MPLVTDEKVLNSIDLERTACPPGFKVEIEGQKPWGIQIPTNLVGAIAHALVFNTGRVVIDSPAFRDKIKVLAFDEKGRYMKVRVSQ